MAGQGDILDKLKELNANSMSSGFTAEEIYHELKGEVNLQSIYRALRDALKNKRIQAGGLPAKFWVRE